LSFKNGLITPSLFDPKSIEMFYLMAQRAKTPTHFYPLALATYHLFPPPETTKKEIGEERVTRKSSISLSLGNEIHMKDFDTIDNKEEKRAKRAEFIYNKMLAEYQKISY
jgi:glycerol-3-phosphate O-acyltransferase